MTKEQIKELNQIRKGLIKVNNDWKQNMIKERVNDIKNCLIL